MFSSLSECYRLKIYSTRRNENEKIGLTTTVPVEVIVAAGYTPVDLNNMFITSENYLKYIDIAERDGFPKSLCAWIKGIYGACLENNIKEIVGVMEGIVLTLKPSLRF